MKKKILIVSLIVFLISLISVFAQQSDPEAIKIANKAEEMNSADSSKSTMLMRIYPYLDDDEEYRDYYIIGYSKGKNDTDSYSEFLKPETAKGIKILSKIENGKELIYVYFPSTKRRRKLASQNKSGSVGGVGGDFSYEDMSAKSLDEDYYLTIENEDSKSWIIKAVPKPESDISYSKVVFTITKDDYLLSKAEYYKEEYGEEYHEKTLSTSALKTYKTGGKTYKYFSKMLMINHYEESKTEIYILEMKYDVDVNNKYFNSNRFYK